jgi:hypothetical protein
MNFEDFTRCKDHAAMLHASQTGDAVLSLDAIFIALNIRAAAPGSKRRATRDAAPTWFTETLSRLAGERVTVSHFLMMAGRLPITRQDSIDVAAWLRDMGKKDRKTGGKLLFDL